MTKKTTFESSDIFSNSAGYWTNIHRTGQKSFGRDIKIENYSLRLIITIKKSIFFESFFSFQILQNIERTFTLLAEKVLCRDIKNESFTLCIQSIMLGKKNFFESFVSFPFIRTWNINFLDLWQQSFHPGCQSCILFVHMNSLWDVGIRSDITWRETLFEPWRKNFDLFRITAFYVFKGTFWINFFFENSDFFFNFFETLNESLLCLARKFSAGISKMKKAVFVS